MTAMLDEITQQPETLADTIAKERETVIGLAGTLQSRSIKLIVLVARGSSDNAALFGRYLLETTTGIPVSLCAPSVHTLYNSKLQMDQALVIGVSQSGEGEDINFVLENCQKCGAFTVGVTNEPDSPMVKVVNEILFTHTGREKSVAATKTYTGQLLLFLMLAAELTGRPELAYDAIPEMAAKALDIRDTIEEIVQRYVFMEHCVVVGRGLIYANAYEFALKLMETCYVVAERFSTADFFHGPLAMVERHFPIFVFAPQGHSLEGARNLIHLLSDLGADTMAISSDPVIARNATCTIQMSPDIGEFVSPIPYIIPAQLFAALLAQKKGLDPDSPRSLSKVTKTL